MLEATLTSLVSDTVHDVFKELNIVTERWTQKLKLFTVSKNNYAQYIERAVSSFPLFGTTRVTSVEHAYVSLSLTTDVERERYRSAEEIAAALHRQRHGGELRETPRGGRFSPLDALESTTSGLALLGNAGSGKTTIFKHLALHIARGTRVRGRKRLAFLLAVREMSSKKEGILEAATKVLSDLEFSEADNVLCSLMKSGQAALLLDGLDETQPIHQKALLEELETLRRRFPNAILAVSSRPYSLSVGLPGFTKWETLPLDLTQRHSFVLKWFKEVDEEKGGLLLKRCRNTPELLDLGSNPLLLSIICALFWNDLDVPNDPDELHARAVEGLLGGWDAFRSIARGTPLAEVPLRRRILLANCIAADLFRDGKIVFSARDLGTVGRIQGITGLKLPSPEVLLQTLYNDFGLLVERSPRLYSFSHLTLQEYLVAQNVVSSRTEMELLGDRLRDPRWFSVIRLVAKFLHDGSEFMTRLSGALNIEVPYEAALLRSAWEGRPNCARGTRTRLIQQLVMSIVSRIRGQAAFEFDRQIGALIARIRPPLADGFQSSGAHDDLPLKDCLLDLLKAILASGVSFTTIGCSDKEPFTVLRDLLPGDLREFVVVPMSRYDEIPVRYRRTPNQTPAPDG
jgi:hypothetical protein